MAAKSFQLSLERVDRNMLNDLKNVGPGAALGILIGLLAIYWIRPTDVGGIALIFIMGFLITTIVVFVIIYVAKLIHSLITRK